jgi:AraC-like DNA-binding protein
MYREQLYQPYEIDFKKLDVFPQVLYKNNFFKLIYIIEGTGIQFMNGHRFNYHKGNLFLITPSNNYSFTIESTTTFFFLNFTDTYIKSKTNKDNDWMERIEYILQNASHGPGCILKNQADKPWVTSLVSCIQKELCDGQIYHNKIIQQIVNSLIFIVARNIALELPQNIKENTDEVVLDILNYVQENIFIQENLRIEKISDCFKISQSYLGRYFKKHTGNTLQAYISNYKLRLIESRLLNSDMRISEIAHELNFTDESHLNKTFKKFVGLSPTEFRKKFA